MKNVQEEPIQGAATLRAIFWEGRRKRTAQRVRSTMEHVEILETIKLRTLSIILFPRGNIDENG